MGVKSRKDQWGPPTGPEEFAPVRPVIVEREEGPLKVRFPATGDWFFYGGRFVLPQLYQVEVAEEGPDALRGYVRSLRTAIDSSVAVIID